MKGNVELRIQNQPNKDLLSKWYRVLLYANAAILMNLLLTILPFWQQIGTWVSQVISICVIVSMFFLKEESSRYRTAAILYAIVQIGGLFTLFFGNSLVTTVVAICGIIASYQEYHGHSEVIEAFDNKLSGRWRGLFYWELVIGLIGGLITTGGVVIGVMGGCGVDVITNVTVTLVSLVTVIPTVMYLRYMKKTLQVIQ